MFIRLATDVILSCHHFSRQQFGDLHRTDEPEDADRHQLLHRQLGPRGRRHRIVLHSVPVPSKSPHRLILLKLDKQPCSHLVVEVCLRRGLCTPPPSKSMLRTLQEKTGRWCHWSVCLVLTIDVYGLPLTLTLKARSGLRNLLRR